MATESDPLKLEPDFLATEDQTSQLGKSISNKLFKCGSEDPTTSSADAGDADTGDDSESGRGSPFSTLSVLAQVASDRLEKEPKKQEKKKLTKRNVQTMDRLNLEQISGLSEKLLVNMFSDTSADEMKRQYTYTCYMVPDICQHDITVYGNELKARLRMKDHLQEHIRDFKRKEEKDDSFDFTAEPIHARKKRIAAERALEKKLKKIVVAGGPKGKGGKSMKTISPSRYTSLLPKAGVSIIVDPNNPALLPVGKPKVRKNIVRHFANKQIGIRLPNNTTSASGTDTTAISSSVSDLSALSSQINLAAAEFTATPEPTGSDVEVVATPPQSLETGNDETVKEMTLNLEQNQAFIMELLSRSQPYHDHCYTTVFGKKPGIESMDLETEGEVEISNNNMDQIPTGTIDPSKTVSVKFNTGTIIDPNHLHIPIIRLQRIGIGPEDIIAGEGDEGAGVGVVTAGSDGQQQQLTVVPTGIEGLQPVDQGTIITEGPDGQLMCQRPYPPMPKSDLALRGRMYLREEVVSEEEQETTAAAAAIATTSATPTTASTTTRRGRKKTAPQWDEERKLALKCIRELRIRKGYKDDTNLVCKICKDKTFTATATLMYHYRSHAGIKPFVCLICNTTFTRQHSLNYHMLIHNNQSRFTCKDCGRKFRHPSHFKEHLRRHTGETPFHCTDCPLRFKTRNTYKRHLMTRHGKLLTASGIKLMPPEDFLKVKTKYYRRGSGEDGESTSLLGEDDIDEEDLGEDDEEEMMETAATQPPSSTLAVAASTSGDGDAAAPAVQTPDTPAANRLLQFCAQVANQMGQVMQTQG